jgi:hypothetical protein
MGMQYDVKSKYRRGNGILVEGRARLKGAFITLTSSSSVAFTNTNTPDGTGTYISSGTVVTVTLNNHGFSAGDNVVLNVTSGNLSTGGFNVVSVTNDNVFVVTGQASLTSSGNTEVLGPSKVLMIAGSNVGGNSFDLILPADGILSDTGIYVYSSGTDVENTVFYG